MSEGVYRSLGFLAVSEAHTVTLSCHHCRVTWTGCAAESVCPECGAMKGYFADDAGECYCEECRAIPTAPTGAGEE